MRALVADPRGVPWARYRRFVRRLECQAFLVDHLVAGEPYPALNALVLGKEDHALLQRLTSAFSEAFLAAGRALRGDVPALVEMGFPWVAAALLAVEEPRQPVVGRFDFARDERGDWWLLELNADTPSGVREAVAGDRLARGLLPGAACLESPNDGFGDRLAEAFGRAVPDGAAFGVVTAAEELEDLAQAAFTAELLRPRLERRGGRVLLGDVHDLRPTARGALTLCGQRVDALYRLIPFEPMIGTPPFAALFDAVARGRLRLLNGLFGLLLQHKGLMAWLWAHRDDSRLGAEARAAVARHLPPTWTIGEWPAREPPGDVVVKQVFGREGEDVHFGGDLGPAEIEAMRREGGYVVQRRVDVAEVDAAVPTSGGAVRWHGRATVGAFAVDGRWGGYYTRFGGRVITGRSKWMATLVG